MRGKAFDPSLIILNKRITPAYAGKREFRRVQTLLHQDHPRLCGEKSAEIMAEHDAEGITPAYAGKSGADFGVFVAPRDHPRLCGEKASVKCRLVRIEGSPPPMRGKDDLRHGRFQRQGITPAYAGKSPYCRQSCLCIRDHPRLCGEKTDACSAAVKALGSPPPMRGKVI